MQVIEIAEILGARVLGEGSSGGCEVVMACGCDLMSDVLSYIKPDSLLLTGLTTPQVVYTAEMVDIAVVCFVRGKTPPRETIELAGEKGIVLLATPLPMFEACGRLYRRGLRGCSEA